MISAVTVAHYGSVFSKYCPQVVTRSYISSFLAYIAALAFISPDFVF